MGEMQAKSDGQLRGAYADRGSEAARTTWRQLR